MLTYYPYIKRVVDIISSASALIILSPLLGAIALLVKITSDGPVLFKQERAGRAMKPFQLIKFRTMICRNASTDPQFDPGDSCRVTSFGKILRKTKLDELPELYNVFKGDMSIVGPRPEVPKYVQLFRGDYKEILSVQPGLSDHASIKYRNEEELLANHIDPEAWYCDVILPDKLRLASTYVRRITLGGDAAIVWGTIKSLLGK